MSVRDGLLTILTLGPAYGLQLHAELTSRAPHRGPINVGQIYSTLDRLSGQGLIAPSGLTSDGLPLHRLTAEGRAAVVQARGVAAVHGLPEFTEMLDQVIIEATVDPDASAAVVRGFRDWWRGDLIAVRKSLTGIGLRADARLALIGRECQGVAALAFLDVASEALATGGTFRPLSAAKPKRGRPLTAARVGP